MSHTVCAKFGSRDWLIGTFVLSLLAVAGSFLSINLFFGIAFIFGSIAAVIAIAFYGTVAGAIVAMVGSAYTFILFGHPYAIVIFTLEMIVVGTLYHRRGMNNLVLADLLYWIVLGALLVVIFYQQTMGMAWTPTLLIVFKQSLNGIFNALIASIFLLIIRMYTLHFFKWSEQKQRISSIFFVVGISIVLLAGISPVVQQSYMLKAERERALTRNLLEKIEDVTRSVKTRKETTAEELQAILDIEYFDDDMSLAILDDAGRPIAAHGVVKSLNHAGIKSVLSDELSIWRPSGKMPTMLRWKNSQYLIVVPFVYKGMSSSIVVEFSAATLVESLEESNLYLFIFIAIFMFISIFVVHGVSYWFAKPINRLEKVGRRMEEQIESGREVDVESSTIYEFDSLGKALQLMASHLARSFDELNQSKGALGARIKRRTRELEFVNDNLRDRQSALDQHAIVSITDLAGSIIDANERFCEISGYSRDELIGQNHRMLKSGQHSTEFYNELWQTITRGEIWRGEICNKTKKGQLYWVQSTITPFLDKKGKPYQFISIRTDISDRKRSEKLLQTSMDQLNRAQVIAKVGSWEFNLETEQLSWSKEHYEIFELNELPPEELFVAYRNKVYADDLEQLDALLLQAKETGEGFHFEYRIICDDGSIKYVLAIGESIFNEENEQVLRGTAQDITEQKHNEQKLITARELADRANKAKSEFLSSMSHELRTPMNAILGFGQLLEMDEVLTNDQLENVQEIIKGGEHLLELINEVLDLSKIESGNIDLIVESVELAGVLQECFNLMEPLANKRNISIELGDVKDIIVRVDRIRLKQALLNLMSNAIKYNKEGGSVGVNIEYADKTNIRILVSDKGYGIAESDLADLFQPFTRVTDDVEGIEGTGIGLTITKRIIELMDGEIDVSSELGVGSTFSLTLPLGGEVKSSNDEAVEIVNESVILNRHKVLYVDDNPINLKIVSKLLSLKKYVQLFTAHSPALGLELAETHQPELILLDINMPVMNGYEVLEILRKNDNFKDTPIIAVTADAMTLEVERGLASGFSEYITKPIDFKKFNETMDKYIVEKD